jgi:hypothetical protein
MTNGVVLIAHNNNRVDYVKQAVYSAKRIKQYLNVPVSIITDSVSHLKENFDFTVFDKIIETKNVETTNTRFMFDGFASKKTVTWKNLNRFNVYELSPYDKTLLLDTDYIICNDMLGNCFDSVHDFLIYKHANDLTDVSKNGEFKFISETSIDFYWATVVYFKKNKKNKIFFDLVNHIQDEWHHYRMLYQISASTFRNDFAFSIAIHILNGYQSGEFAKRLPGKLHFVPDTSVIIDSNDNKLKFLVYNDKNSDHCSLIQTDALDVHVMNKFSLERMIDKESKSV